MALFEFSPVAIIRAIKGGATRALARIRPDHLSIQKRTIKFGRMNMPRLYLYQAVAPGRRAVRKHDDGQVARAARLAAEVLGDAAGRADGAKAQWTSFRAEHTDGTPEFLMYVHPTGLVELMWELPVPDDEAGDVWVLGSEIARRVMKLADAVSTEAYAQVSALARPARRRARVDWHFDIATRINGTNGPRNWTGIEFVGEQPPRTRQEWVDPPTYGYDGGKFWSRRRRTTDADLATLLLERLAADSGYHDCQAAVARTVAAAQGPIAPQPGQIAT